MRKLSIKIEVSDATAVMFAVFDVDTSVGGDPQTLPDFADVPDGYVVMVDDVGGNCGTTPAEISGDATIDGEANYELRVDDGKVFFRKDAGAGEWKRVGNAPGAEDVLLEYAVNTSGGPVSITLPSVASVPNGFIVRVYDTTGNAATNNITVDRFDAPDAIDGEVSYTISDNYGAVWLVGNGIASWAIQGYLPVVEAQTYLHQLAIDAGAKHVWLGPDNPLEDLVGAADLTLITTGEAAAHIPQGTRSALVRANGGVSSGAGPSAAGVTIHKGAQRSGIYMFTLGAAPSGHMGVMALGTYTDANSGPAITANSAVSRVRFFDHNWGVGSGLDLFDYTGNLGVPCVVFWWWDLANLVYRVAWRLEGSAEQTGTLAAVSEGSGTVTVYAGAQGSAMNTITAPFTRHAFALADGDVIYDAAFRASVYNALGWA